MEPKTVLITGCSKGGIGDALARTFHRKGLRVFATARNPAKIQHLEDMGIEVLTLDVVDVASIKRAVVEVETATKGTLDILVNNSGGGYSMPLLDTEVSVARQVFDVNVFALVAVTQAFMPLLAASHGTVVNIGSVLGHTPLPWCGYYNASKAAANLLTDQLRIELSPWNIKCIVVKAGAVRTKFFENLAEDPHLPEGSLYSPAKAEIEHSMSGDDLKRNAMDVEQCAEEIVNNVLKANPKKHHWLGGGSFNIWLMFTFGWATVWDVVLPGFANLTAITRKIRENTMTSRPKVT